MSDHPLTDEAILASGGQWTFLLRDLCRRLEQNLEQERQDRKQADLDTIRALGERNEARTEIAVWKQDVKLLEAELQKFDQAAIEWWCEYQDLKAKAGDDRAEIEQIKATLANPHAVHVNMLRGTIQWTPANLRHLLGET